MASVKTTTTTVIDPAGEVATSTKTLLVGGDDPAPPVSITSKFDGGNAEVLSVETAGSTAVAELKISPEPFTEGTDKRQHMQWFYFKASNVRGRDCRFNIVNAKECSYPNSWPGTWAVVSVDRETWTRTPTTFDPSTGTLSITVSGLDSDVVWVAYFAPYSHERHQSLIARCQKAVGSDGRRLCSVAAVGRSLDGREIEMITVGNGPAKVWVVARQHPGEPMAEWWADGFLARILDKDDAVSRKVRSMATLRVIPCLCPDGAVRGHLRTNAAGANLNREWGNTGDYEAPTKERSPEVLAVLTLMKKVGCDFFLDVHGDEELPHIFLAPETGVPKWNDRHAELYRMTCETQLKLCPAFQVKHGYGNDAPSDANLAIAAASVANHFDCASYTLEMPYKDSYELPDKVEGWSPQRCEQLGGTMCDVLHHVLPYVRAPFPFGNGGVGDGLECPEWAVAGYVNPPSEQCWDTTPRA